MNVPHFHKVDKSKIKACFSPNKEHRSSLTVPLTNRVKRKILCIIGQNPSYANKKYADKTLRYLERFVYEKYPEYSQIIMLNLFSRVDTTKTKTGRLLSLSAESKFAKIVDANDDFLIIYGKLKNQRAYKFIQKARKIKNMLVGKNNLKIGVDGLNYAPHPGNRKIRYSNFSFFLTKYDFSDI
jgi:hypothetical protein